MLSRSRLPCAQRKGLVSIAAAEVGVSKYFCSHSVGRNCKRKRLVVTRDKCSYTIEDSCS